MDHGYRHHKYATSSIEYRSRRHRIWNMQRSVVVVLLILTIPILAAFNGAKDSKFTSVSAANDSAERVQLAELLNESVSNNTNTFLYQYVNTNTNANTTNFPNIVGGNPANDNEFPWFGRTNILFYSRFRVFREILFGASLIHSDIVVSAAHCVVDTLRQNPDSSVAIQFYLGAKQYDGSDGNLFHVAEIIWPNSYDSSSKSDDIVFYRLSHSADVDPVSWNADPLIPLPGDIGTVIGFGSRNNRRRDYSPILLKADIPAISTEQCQLLLLVDTDLPNSITCTNTPGEGKSACYGDSGGPILTPNGSIYGLVSFGPTICMNGPTAYTSTFYFREYIPKVICDYSFNPIVPCVGFEDTEVLGIGTHAAVVDPVLPCGLFGWRLFSSFTFGGILGRLFRSIFGQS